MRKSEELLKWGKNTRVCKYGTCGFLLRKNGCSDSVCRVAAAFLLWPSACGFPLLHGLPGRSQPANQLNIALLMLFGNPVGIRNNRPLLCLSQRACGINWVYHALTGECSLIYPYLRINRLHFFVKHHKKLPFCDLNTSFTPLLHFTSPTIHKVFRCL